MVRLTAEYIEKKCSQTKVCKSLNKQFEKNHLCRLTHLRMNDMFISGIGNFAVCKNLKVVYLQNNNISKIENLHFASNLTHLYLQHNVVSKIENLDCLEKLQTLHLGYNRISVVEGLENLKNLTVLHIENQKISIGETLCFDPRSIYALSNCLKILNISGNNVKSLRAIKNLNELELLDVGNNKIDNIDDLTESISTLTSLRNLSLQENPVTRHFRCKENLIANNETIESINGKTVTDVCRCFMKRFQMEKHLRHTRRAPKIRLDDDLMSSLNLPPAFKKSISRAMFQPFGPKFTIKVSSLTSEEKPQMFPPWKKAPGANAVRGSHMMPRLLWNNVIKNKQPRIGRSLINSKAITLPPI